MRVEYDCASSDDDAVMGEYTVHKCCNRTFQKAFTFPYSGCLPIGPEACI